MQYIKEFLVWLWLKTKFKKNPWDSDSIRAKFFETPTTKSRHVVSVDQWRPHTTISLLNERSLTWEIVLLRLKAGSDREWIFMISKFWRTALRHLEAKFIYCLSYTFFYTALKHFGILSFWQELYTPIPKLSILPALYIFVARVSSALFTSNQKVGSK